MPSFDVVSQVDMQEVDNAVNQVRKELNHRYDFRNSKSEVQFERGSNITLVADDSMKLKALASMLNEKMAKRGVGVRALDYKEPESSVGTSLKQKIEIKQGISRENAKKIVKIIKDEKLKKIQAQIQQDQIRVTGPKKDDLQSVIELLKTKVDNLELQFVNFQD